MTAVGGALLRLLLRVTVTILALAALVQGVALAAAIWDESMLESSLLHELGPHQTPRAMEGAIARRVRAHTGLTPQTVRVGVVCPAPGPPGPLEAVAPTCLLDATVGYERRVLLISRNVNLHASEKVFAEAVPRGRR